MATEHIGARVTDRDTIEGVRHALAEQYGDSLGRFEGVNWGNGWARIQTDETEAPGGNRYRRARRQSRWDETESQGEAQGQSEAMTWVPPDEVQAEADGSKRQPDDIPTPATEQTTEGGPSDESQVLADRLDEISETVDGFNQ